MPVGQYTFTVNVKGFKSAVGSLEVQLNVRSSIAITLQLGEVTQKVEVSSSVAPVETTSTQITDTFTAVPGRESSDRFRGREPLGLAQSRRRGH